MVAKNVITFCSQLVIDFNNGSTPLTFTVEWLVALNPLIGNRIFDIEAPPKLVFGGPGKSPVEGLWALTLQIRPSPLLM